VYEIREAWRGSGGLCTIVFLLCCWLLKKLQATRFAAPGSCSIKVVVEENARGVLAGLNFAELMMKGGVVVRGL
jgi:hypothetical protein